MTNFFKENEFFTPNQYGFRNKRSCTHAIGEVLDYIRNEMDKCMEKYGFRGKILCLLSNYLENRQQYVEQNQIRSSPKNWRHAYRKDQSWVHTYS